MVKKRLVSGKVRPLPKDWIDSLVGVALGGEGSGPKEGEAIEVGGIRLRECWEGNPSTSELSMCWLSVVVSSPQVSMVEMPSSRLVP